MNNVLTKQIKKEIRRLVEPLPPMLSGTEKVKLLVSGEQLIHAGTLMEKNGQPINPKKNYTVEVNKDINHRTEGEKNYKANGMPGVLAYVQECWDIYKKQLEDSAPKVVKK